MARCMTVLCAADLGMPDWTRDEEAIGGPTVFTHRVPCLLQLAP